jgi:hypothetical protein
MRPSHAAFSFIAAALLVALAPPARATSPEMKKFLEQLPKAPKDRDYKGIGLTDDEVATLTEEQVGQWQKDGAGMLNEVLRGKCIDPLSEGKGFGVKGMKPAVILRRLALGCPFSHLIVDHTDPAFTKQVLGYAHELMPEKAETGRALLDQLVSGHFHEFKKPGTFLVLVQPADAHSSDPALCRTEGSSMNGQFCVDKPGYGTHAFVKLAKGVGAMKKLVPSVYKAKEHTAIDAPEFLTFAHELVHAHRYVRGLGTRGDLPAMRDEKPYEGEDPKHPFQELLGHDLTSNQAALALWKVAWTEDEEYQTIGGPMKKPYEFTENALRDEHKLPHREFHCTPEDKSCAGKVDELLKMLGLRK